MRYHVCLGYPVYTTAIHTTRVRPVKASLTSWAIARVHADGDLGLAWPGSFG